MAVKTANRAEVEEEVEAAPPTNGRKKLIIIAVSAVVALGVAIGVTLALTASSPDGTDAADAAEVPVESMYVELKPEFVINFRDRNDRPKFLKAEMSVATSEQKVAEAVARHMPAIRNSLVLLLSRQIYDDLVPHEGKEKLRAEALAEVQAVLESQIGEAGVDDLYFSSFVMH